MEREAEDQLHERVRALYEASDVPVAAIARLVGVSERTIYKYIARGGWQRRRVLQSEATMLASAVRRTQRRAAGEGVVATAATRAASDPRLKLSGPGASGGSSPCAERKPIVRADTSGIAADDVAALAERAAEAARVRDSARLAQRSREAELREAYQEARIAALRARAARDELHVEERKRALAEQAARLAEQQDADQQDMDELRQELCRKIDNLRLQHQATLARERGEVPPAGPGAVSPPPKLGQ